MLDRLTNKQRVWLREFFRLSLETTQSSFANRTHQANIETYDRRTVFSSVLQHQLSQGNENELFILVQVRDTRNYCNPLLCSLFKQVEACWSLSGNLYFPRHLPWKIWPPHLAFEAAGSATVPWSHDPSPVPDKRRIHPYRCRVSDKTVLICREAV